MEALRKRGLHVAAVSYDPVPVLKDFARRRSISFPLLSDAGSAVLRRFGMLDPEIREGDFAFGVPAAGTLIVDAKGVVREKYFEDKYDRRRTAGSILAHQGVPIEAGVETRTDHFVLRTSTSNLEVARGQRVTLVLDFEMKDERHAYAPGVKGYRPLTLRVEPQPLVTVHEPVYPQPRDYVFKPLRETVPVFEGRFRILQDITLAATKEGGHALTELFKGDDPSFAIAGALEYQVCSDTVCYPPASLPLRWTLKARRLELERPPEAIRRKLPTQ